MAENGAKKSSFKVFMIIWAGQFVSLLGSGMTGFALPIWVFAQTGEATQLTTIGGIFITSLLLASPIAGVLVDRSNRKFMMMISDLASGVVTIAVFILFAAGRLEIWHLYIGVAFMGFFNSFQWPAFSSAISVMLNKEDYTRASSLLQTAQMATGIIAPSAAGAVLGLVGGKGNFDQALQIIFLIDIVTFLFAIGTLLFVHIPQPERSAAQEEAEAGGFWGEVAFGFTYVLKRPSLVLLQTVFMLGNLFLSMSFALMAPMLLSRTGSDELFFGVLQTITALGGVAGGLIISAWGGFKKNINGVLIGWAMSGLLGTVLMGFGRYDPVWMRGFWIAAGFLGMAFSPLINGSNQAIWQAKVPPDIQGKVFSVRRLIAWLVNPLATFIAGPLADNVLEPAMTVDGGFSRLFTPLVGSGPGSGMSVTYIITGLVVAVVALGGFFVPAIRDVESRLPDHDQVGSQAPDELEGLEAAEAGVGD